MGSSSSQTTYSQEILALPPNNFTQQELQKLYKRFNQLSNNTKYIKPQQLQQLPEIKLNPLSQRISNFFVDDTDKQTISFQSFVTALNVFNHKTSQEVKLNFLFNLYDIDQNGVISSTEIYQVLSEIVGTKNISEKQLQILVEGIMTEGDKDKDGVLNKEEFYEVIKSGCDISDKLTIRF